MATLPIPGLLAEFKILGLQAMDFGAQLSHFRARVLHWGDQIREEMTGNTDLCQLAVHDHLDVTDRTLLVISRRFSLKRRVRPKNGGNGREEHQERVKRRPTAEKRGQEAAQSAQILHL